MHTLSDYFERQEQLEYALIDARKLGPDGHKRVQELIRALAAVQNRIDAMDDDNDDDGR